MQPIVNASVSWARFDSISAASARAYGYLRRERESATVLVGRMVQADFSDMHGLVTRVAQELGEHRRQRVVDEQPH